ncbi:hypothetical protein D3C80_807770 [compost metagenome]
MCLILGRVHLEAWGYWIAAFNSGSSSTLSFIAAGSCAFRLSMIKRSLSNCRISSAFIYVALDGRAPIFSRLDD